MVLCSMRDAGKQVDMTHQQVHPTIPGSVIRAVFGAAAANGFICSSIESTDESTVADRVVFERPGERDATLVVHFDAERGEVLNARIVSPRLHAVGDFTFRVEIAGHMTLTNQHPFDFVDGAARWLDVQVAEEAPVR